jgi:glycosyltransferase involved in cell wall biosynthesis
MGKKKGTGHVGRHTQQRGRAAAVPGAVPSRSVSGDTRAGICWHSNFAGAGTGYGVQTAQVARQIKATGRPITLSNNYGTQGFITEWEGIEVLPTGFHPYSADVLGAHLAYSQDQTGRPTALITLFDAWVYKASNLKDIKIIASWMPIDHTPAPPDVLEWCRRDNVLPIAMAQFGARMLDAAGIDHRYIPHGVDTTVFRPGATVDGATGRQLLNIPEDAFLVGIVAANKGIAPMRKAWGENLLALGQFMASHDDVYVYMHTEKRGAQGGVDLVQLAAACGIPENRIVWTDQWAYYAGLPPFVLAGLMSAMDVNLAASRGEGFGVPVIEAAACGVPSIVSNFTAQPELVEGHGYLASVQPYWDALQTSWFATPLVHSVIEELEHAYNTARDADRKAAARAHAETYDNKIVFDKYWLPVLAEIDELMAA